MAKKLIQRGLDITVRYELISTYYRSMEEGGGCCENCGKMISNIAEVKSEDGHKYTVGMDCAATLTGIKGDFDFEYVHKANFNTAKSARAGVVKALKKGAKNLSLKTFTDDKNFFKQVGAGKWEYEFASGGYNWKQYRADVWQNYVLPMLKDLVDKQPA